MAGDQCTALLGRAVDTIVALCAKVTRDEDETRTLWATVVQTLRKDPGSAASATLLWYCSRRTTPRGAAAAAPPPTSEDSLDVWALENSYGVRVVDRVLVAVALWLARPTPYSCATPTGSSHRNSWRRRCSTFWRRRPGTKRGRTRSWVPFVGGPGRRDPRLPRPFRTLSRATGPLRSPRRPRPRGVTGFPFSCANSPPTPCARTSSKPW